MAESPSTASGFPVDKPHLPDVTIGDAARAHRLCVASTISVLVPAGLDGGRTAVRVADVPGETALLEVGTPLATGLHQVDNPVFDREGNLYVTYSGTRGQDVPVSIFRVSPSGRRESFVSGIVNPTSMAFDAGGHLYVSSRFEGAVYRVHPRRHARDRTRAIWASHAASHSIASGVLYVGDRSGTVFAVQPRPDRQCRRDAAGQRRGVSSRRRSRRLRVRDGADAWSVRLMCIASIPRSGSIDKVYSGFGRPQGIAFDSQGALYVVEALAGSNGLYRVRPGGTRRADRRGAVAGRCGVQPERRPGRRVERHRVPARCGHSAACLGPHIESFGCG